MDINTMRDWIVAFLEQESSQANFEAALTKMQAHVISQDPTLAELAELDDKLGLYYQEKGELSVFQLISTCWMPSNPFGNSPVIHVYSRMELEEQFASIDTLMKSMPWAFVIGKLQMLISGLKLPPSSPAIYLADQNILGAIILVPLSGHMEIDEMRPYMESYLKAIKALV